MKSKNQEILKQKRSKNYLDLLIVEALGKYGPRNIFRIARELGLPEATVRYRIRKMKNEGKLIMSTSIYHTYLGLKKNLVFTDINPRYHEIMPEFFRRIDYWSYMKYVHGRREGFHALYIAPEKNVKNIREFIREMVKLDLIYDYNIYYSTCLYGVNPTTKWYDLESGELNFDFNSIPNIIDNSDTQLPYNLRDPDSYPILADDVDIYILKELEIDPTISYKDLAEKLATTPQNIYYHYHRHIIKNRLIEGFNIFYRKFNPDTSLVIYFIFDFPNYTSFAKTTNAFRTLPIMHSMGKIIGKNELFAVSYIPVENAKDLFRTMNNLVKIGILRDYEYRIGYYREYAKRQTIAYKMFKNGEWLYPHEEYMNELYEYYRKALAEIIN